jgi:hypothetical protein
MNENISYVLESDKNDNNENIISELMTKFNNVKLDNKSIELDGMYASAIFYDENYTTKQLLQICDYYGFTKELRNTKSKKQDITSAIVMFENISENSSIVYRRKALWDYINQLKNDKFMRKFVIW